MSQQSNRSAIKQMLWFLSGVMITGAIFYLFTYSTYEEKEDKSHQRMFEQDYNIYSLNLPQKIQFAGEDVPLHLVDVREKLDRELLVNTYWQSNTMLLIKRKERWFPVIEPILKANGVPEDFKYLALIESGFTQVISPAGATGFWQIMKSSGKEGGLRITSEVDERYHIEKATIFACNYLKEAKEKFGSWTLAAASYNMGMNGMQRQLSRQKATNYYDLLLNEETSRYVFRILAVKTILNDPESFGFNFRPKDLYPPLNTQEIILDSTVNDFTLYAYQLGINYKVLKYLNPWLRQSYLHVQKGDTYQIKVPEESLRKNLMINLPQWEEDTLTQSE
jgi:membrane-bound lytic murein transglycosylase D